MRCHFSRTPDTRGSPGLPLARVYHFQPQHRNGPRNGPYRPDWAQKFSSQSRDPRAVFGAFAFCLPLAPGTLAVNNRTYRPDAQRSPRPLNLNRRYIPAVSKIAVNILRSSEPLSYWCVHRRSKLKRGVRFKGRGLPLYVRYQVFRCGCELRGCEMRAANRTRNKRNKSCGGDRGTEIMQFPEPRAVGNGRK